MEPPLCTNGSAGYLMQLVLTLSCLTSPITLCGKTCEFERKYVLFVTPVSQKRIHRAICFILDLLSGQMNITYTKFLGICMKL